MTGDVYFTWHGKFVRATLDARGRWRTDGPKDLADLLNHSYPITGLLGRRRAVYRVRLNAVAKRFGGTPRLPGPEFFPPPRYPEDHPGYIRLQGRSAG